MLNFEGNRGTKNNIGEQETTFEEQGNMPIYFRGTWEQIPPWEGLIYRVIIIESILYCSKLCLLLV